MELTRCWARDTAASERGAAPALMELTVQWTVICGSVCRGVLSSCLSRYLGSRLVSAFAHLFIGLALNFRPPLQGPLFHLGEH